MKSLVLIGQSGSGKTTLGRSVAAKLGVSFCDLDVQLTEASGKSIDELLSQGEDKFRSLETAQLESAMLAGYEMISTGGGAVLSEKNRQIMENEASVIWLECGVENLAERLEGTTDRPLLDTEMLTDSLSEQRRQRLKYYFLAADARIDVGGRSVEEACDLIVNTANELAENNKLGSKPKMVERVELQDGTGYDIVIGDGVLSSINDYLPEEAKRAVIISQAGIEFELDLEIESIRIDIEQGEEAKQMRTIEMLGSEFSEFGLTRNDVVVSLGGGVVTDIAGFAAATYHRGVSVIHVPTTLLGQVDAAIGGKCGVNLPEGKNLVGAFWQPEVVICDTRTLTTLPAEEFRNGIGEVAKYELLKPTLEQAGCDFSGLEAPFNELTLSELITISARMKAFVVSNDELEAGMRAVLNYGHTLAHAIETHGNFQQNHGTAVVKGLIFAAELARSLGRIDTSRVTEHYEVAEKYGFDKRLRGEFDPEEILKLMERDKKAVDGLTFVLDGENGIEPVVVDDKSAVSEILNTMISGPVSAEADEDS